MNRARGRLAISGPEPDQRDAVGLRPVLDVRVLRDRRLVVTLRGHGNYAARKDQA
jgi:hypothetical protein